MERHKHGRLRELILKETNHKSAGRKDVVNEVCTAAASAAVKAMSKERNWPSSALKRSGKGHGVMPNAAIH